MLRMRLAPAFVGETDSYTCVITSLCVGEGGTTGRLFGCVGFLNCSDGEVIDENR